MIEDANNPDIPQRVVETFPRHIWLDIGDAPYGTTFQELGEATWSEDNASGNGVKYVRADIPVDIVTHCEKCGLQHVDAVEELPMPLPGSSLEGSAGWTNPPHRSHLCHGCGHIWRPADVPTNGVLAVKTQGKADSPLVSLVTSMEPQWIVNSLGELGVKVGERFFFLYKGYSIEYGEPGEEFAMYSDGEPMKYRIVGKREFGETQWPDAWLRAGRRESRYSVNLEYIPGLSDGKPEDAEWRNLPAKKEEVNHG